MNSRRSLSISWAFLQLRDPLLFEFFQTNFNAMLAAGFVLPQLVCGGCTCALLGCLPLHPRRDSSIYKGHTSSNCATLAKDKGGIYTRLRQKKLAAEQLCMGFRRNPPPSRIPVVAPHTQPSGATAKGLPERNPFPRPLWMEYWARPAHHPKHSRSAASFFVSA